MIPLMTVLIATYGTARLLNDCLAQPKGKAEVLMWIISVGAIGVMWVIVLMVLAQGAAIAL